MSPPHSPSLRVALIGLAWLCVVGVPAAAWAQPSERSAPPGQPAPVDAIPDAIAGWRPWQQPTADAAPSLDDVMRKARREGFSWDIEFEFGGPLWGNTMQPSWDGYWQDLASVVSFSHADYSPLFRTRIGFLSLKEPYYFSAGGLFSYGGVGGAAIGLQASLTSVWGGVWLQGEVAWSFERGMILALAGGYSLFGAEVRAFDGGRNAAIIIKLRLPLGLYYFSKYVADRRTQGSLAD